MDSFTSATSNEIIALLQTAPATRRPAEVARATNWFRQKTDSLRKLETQVIQEILQECIYHHVAADGIIIRQGTNGDCFFILLNGNASVYVDSKRSNELRLLPLSAIRETHPLRASFLPEIGKGFVTSISPEAAAVSKTVTDTEQMPANNRSELKQTKSVPGDLSLFQETNDEIIPAPQNTLVTKKNALVVPTITMLPATASTALEAVKGSVCDFNVGGVPQDSTPIATAVALAGNNAPDYPLQNPAVERSPINRLSETKRKFSRTLSADFSEVIPVLLKRSGANVALLRRRESYTYRSNNATNEEESDGWRSRENNLSRSRRNSLLEDEAIEARVQRIGKARCEPNERRRLGTLMKNYGPGATFGELALLNPHSTRSASIVADTECDLLVVSRALYKKCIKSYQEKEYRAVLKLIEGEPMFAGWSNRLKHQMGLELRKVYVHANEAVVTQGSKCDGLRFLASGSLLLTADPKKHREQYDDFFEKKERINKEISMRMYFGKPKKDVEISMMINSGIIGAEEVGLGLKTYLTTYCTLTDCEFYQLDQRGINRLITKRPASVLVLARMALTRLGNVGHWNEEAKQRLEILPGLIRHGEKVEARLMLKTHEGGINQFQKRNPLEESKEEVMKNSHLNLYLRKGPALSNHSVPGTARNLLLHRKKME